MSNLMPEPATDFVKDTVELLEKERESAAVASQYLNQRDAADKRISQLNSRRSGLLMWAKEKPGCLSTFLLSTVVWLTFITVLNGIPSCKDWLWGSMLGEQGSLYGRAVMFFYFGSIIYIPIIVRWLMGIPGRKRADERGREAVIIIPQQIEEQKKLRAIADMKVHELYASSSSTLALEYWDVSVIDKMIHLTCEMQLPTLAATIAEYRRRQEFAQAQAQAEAANRQRQEEAQQIIDSQERLSRQLDYTNWNIILQNLNRR